MSANTNLSLSIRDSSDVESTTMTLKPSRVNGNVFFYRGDPIAAGPSAIVGSQYEASFSVRQGSPYISATDKSRVKRKLTGKIRIPVPVLGASGALVLDYVDVDVSVAIPVGIDAGYAYTAVKNLDLLKADPVEDMLLAGNDPY